MISADTVYSVDVSDEPRGWLAHSLRLPTTALVVGAMLLSGSLLVLLVLLPPPPSNFEVVSRGRLTLRIPAFFAVMFGFYIASVPIAVRSAVRSVRSMTGVNEIALEIFARELVRVPRSWFWSGVVSGCVAHVCILVGIGFSWDEYGRADLLATRIGFVMVMGWVHAPVLGLAIAVLLRQGLLYMRIGREVGPVDLLDHTALTPFVHASLRLTLLHTLWTGCIAAFHVDWTGSLDVAPQALALMPMYLILSGFLFMLPLWGIHHRLRTERIAELSRVNAAIHGDRNALGGSLVAADAATLNAVDLLAYRDHVRAFSTWPFDANALLRLGLYLGIPLLGWVGAAFVERGVDLLLE